MGSSSMIKILAMVLSESSRDRSTLYVGTDRCVSKP